MEVFYAEDKKADRLLFQLALNDIPLDVKLTMAEDGKKAMEILSNGYKPDIILLDIQMPFKDGNECLKEIRAQERFKNTPVVMFTTSALETDVQTAYDRHANLYIQKPFDITVQAEILRNVLTLNWKDYFPQPPRDKFLFSLPENK